MNWTKIKEQYPKAFYNLKKAYLLYEMTHSGNIVLMEKTGHDQLTSKDTFKSFDESLLVYYFNTHKINFSMKSSMIDSFNYGFEELEKQLE
jgi:hypothetical protein